MEYWRIEGPYNGDDLPEPVRRRMVERTARYAPADYNGVLNENAVERLHDTYNNNDFGVLTGFKAGNTKKENLAMQFNLAEKIRGLHLLPIPHIGFWDNMPHRCLFVPEMKKSQARELSQEFEQSAYIWGSEGLWLCFSTETGDVLCRDKRFKYIDFDEQFMLYYRISRRISSMRTEHENILVNHPRMNKERKERMNILQRQIQDLERLEKEIIEKQF